MSATPSPSWSPRRSIRPAMRSRRSRSTGRRCPPWSASSMPSRRGAAGLARPSRQRAVRRAGRRQESHRSRVRQSPCGRRNIHRQSARHHQLHGNPRRGLRIRRQARPSDADDRQPGQPSLARNYWRDGPEDSARKDAGDLPGCRRRLRHQAVSLSRIRADCGRLPQAAQNREVDGRPRRPLHGRRAGARQRHHGADGARRGRQVPRDGRRSDGRHGRVSVDLRALHSPRRRRHAARPLRHPGLPLPGPHRLHPYRAGRRLSRRRTPRGGLRGRAAGRCRRAKTRHDAGCDPAQEFHLAEGDAVQDRDRKGLRFRRFHRAYEAGDGNRQLEGVSQARQGGQEAGSGAGHRARDLCRGLRHHGRGDRQGAARSRWRRHHPDRHPVERAGPSDRLCATRRRAVRAGARARPHPPGRHR